jgi:hypothetical protein
MKITANVAVLTTNERTRAALRSIRAARFILKPSRTSKASPTSSMIVALLADLDRAQGRHELEDLIDTVKNNVPVVLMSAKAGAPRSDAAFQALAHVTWLVGREVYIAPNAEAVSRMVFARQAKAEAALIASATIEDGKLIVWSCEPRRYAVAASEIPALARVSPSALADFEVSETGSCIHWKDGDVDLDLEGIRAYADPEARRQHEAARRKDAARYAGAIRKFREEHGLKQTDIKGLSERQVRRLEGGDTFPHSSTLNKLAAAHGMSVNDYMGELAKRSSQRASGSRRSKARPKPAARR